MYSAWAQKRRLRFELVTGSLLLLGISIFLYVGLSKPPTCFDNKQNQMEIGIDCGGECSARCAFEVQDMQLLWTRPFAVTSDYWNAVAYIENPNFDSYVENLPYHFLVYDDENNLIIERKGTTFISGDAVVPVFSGGLDVGSRVPRRAVFEWEVEPFWQRMENKPEVKISAERLVQSPTTQRLTANIKNTEVRELRNVEVTAILFGQNKNAIASSQTLVEYLAPLETAELTWTWPEPFTEEVARKEIVPRIPIQHL